MKNKSSLGASPRGASRAFLWTSLLGAALAACDGTSTAGSEGGYHPGSGGTSSAGGAPSSSTGGASTSSTGGAPSSSTGGAPSSSTGGGLTTSSTAASTSSSSSSGQMMGNHPPKFLVLGTDIMTITAGGKVTITAVLTDPDGIDDLVGGTLIDENGALLGAFATSGQEGSYQMTVTWDQLNTVIPINLAFATTDQRILKAQFFDQAGNAAEMPVSITLTCKGLGACDGKCLDTSTDAANCGACGNHCATNERCAEGDCVKWSTCQVSVTTCNQACLAMGKTCHNACSNGVNYTVGSLFWSNKACTVGGAYHDCDTAVPSTVGALCCCGS